MKIEKHGSGYRVRKTIAGKKIVLTYPYKPTERQVTLDMMNYKESITTYNKSFGKMAEEYINLKKGVLSPSSVNGYKFVLNILSEDFKMLDLMEVNTETTQREITRLSASYSPKTCRNAHGFISAVLKMYAPETNLHTTLPQRVEADTYVPTKDDVKMILDAAKGTNYEIAIHLAALGLRRSEILALEKSDLKGDILTINKARVKTEDGTYVTKTTKTIAGTRKLKIPPYLVKMISECDEIYPVKDAGGLYKWLQRTQKKLGLPQFKLHAMRYFFCSNAHSMGVPDAYIMEMGGWQSETTMKSVYRRALSDVSEQMQDKVMDFMSELTN